MVRVDELIKKLPLRGKNVLIIANQDDADIINGMLAVHNEFAHDYDNIYRYFYTGNIYTTCQKLWDFLKDNFTYNAEDVELQTVRSPREILTGKRIDCKHYSLFIGGVLDAIKRNEGGNWEWFYRYASYQDKKVAGHVFVVVKDSKGNEIWVDPVLNYFDQDKAPTYILDKKPMALRKLSGIGATGKTVEIPKKQAFKAFLVLLNLNCFNLADLMKKHPEVTTGPVYQYMKANGLDYTNFMDVLKHAQK